MLFSKHILTLLGLVRLVAAAKNSSNKNAASWHPTYHRKAVNAHYNTSATKHHFDDYTGYQEYQNDRHHDIRNHKRHGKHIFHGKHKPVLPLHDDSVVVHTLIPSIVDPGSSPVNAAAFKKSSSLSKNTTIKTSSSPAKMVGESSRRSAGRGYKLIKEYSGSTFFDDMSFYTEDDPSKGMIDYVSKKEAQQAGLIGTKNGNAYMKIGPGYSNGVQKSVRISTELTFTTGIMILDAYHMPTGCGIWPAFWSMPKNPSGGWPHGGEIDLIEGVHYHNRNMMSIHAPSWCSVDTSVIDMLGELAMPDKDLAGNCDPKMTNDQGCGIKSQTDGDYGRAYNLAGGGVHALYWDSNEGIHAFFFPRNKIPSDLDENNPDPSKWGTPKASWPATHCKPDDYFREHAAVFTNTVCGTWAGSSSVWNNAMGGQDFTCREHTGQPSCWDYMKSGSADLSTAFWEMKTLKIYQTDRRE